MAHTDEIKQLFSHEDTPIVEHKIHTLPIILISTVATFLLGYTVVGSYRQKNPAPAPTPTPSPIVLPTLTTTSTPTLVLTVNTSPKPTSKPKQIPTQIIYPTLPPLPISIPTSIPQPTSAPVLNCAGTARDEYSQVYITPRSVQVGSSSTISIELRDCNKNLAADDWMSADLVSNSPTAKINGLPFPQRIQAKAGRVSFTVTAQAAGTVSIKLTNVNQNFQVTEPGYKTPYVIFTSAATPTATTAPTANPTATHSPTPNPTPTM